MFIVRAEFQSLKNFRHHPAVMALIGIPDYCTKCSPVGWTCGLRFLDQISQGLFADDWKDDIAHDAIRFIQGRAPPTRFRSSSSSRSTRCSARAPM
jgi:hypothetical protein